jgi:PAS domain S-box-containing protein
MGLKEAVDLQSVIPAAALSRRPSRAADHAAENAALIALAQEMAASPNEILRKLVDAALTLCRAHSAGISLLDEERSRFVWPVIAGRWASFTGGGTPAGFGPCGTVCEVGAALLFAHPERDFPYLADASPPIDEALLLPFSVGGEVVGTIWVVAHDESLRFESEDLRILTNLAAFASAAYHASIARNAVARASAQRDKSEAALQQREERLARELEDAKLLQAVSSHLIGEGSAQALYEKILDAAVALLRSDMGTMQMVDPARGGLRLLAWRGFSDAFAESFEYVGPDASTTCGEALRTGRRAIASDIETCDYIAGTAACEAHLAVGVHAAQSTPLISRGGRLLGLISTHWRERHEPSEHNLRLLDVLARQAADLIERRRAEEALQESLAAQVAAREAIARSEERYRSLVDVITDVPWISDEEGSFVTPQPAWEAYTGQSWEEMRGTGWAKALHGEDRDELLAAFDRARETRSLYQASGRVWHAASRQYRYFEARATPLLQRDGSVREWVGTCTDVHERKVAEERLRQADRVKDEFLATLSHELRTPLTSIVGWAQLLSDDRLTKSESSVALATIVRSAKAQTQLIDEVLDVSQITTGKMRLRRQASDLAAIVEAAVEAVRPAAEARSIGMTLSLDRTGIGGLFVDPARIQQVVWNLLSNAIKFSPPRSTVEVTLRREDSTAVIEVRDQGVGIGRDFLPHVFERFRQADSSSSRSYMGLGLGLAIVKELTELHGGTTEVVSEEGKGACFTVRLPMTAAPAVAAPREQEQTGRAGDEDTLRGVRVLYVDDREDGRQLVGVMLGKSGAEVVSAESVDDALAAMARSKPDVVVTDIAMPVRDGYDLLASIRSNSAWETLPVVVLTAHGAVDDEARAASAGFREYLRKPVHADVLTAAVARATAREGVPPALRERR